MTAVEGKVHMHSNITEYFKVHNQPTTTLISHL